MREKRNVYMVLVGKQVGTLPGLTWQKLAGCSVVGTSRVSTFLRNVCEILTTRGYVPQACNLRGRLKYAEHGAPTIYQPLIQCKPSSIFASVLGTKSS